MAPRKSYGMMVEQVHEHTTKRSRLLFDRACFAPIARRVRHRGWRLIAMAALLVACQEVGLPAQPSPSPIGISLPGDLLGKGAPPTQQIATVGYLLVDQSGATLVDQLAFQPDGRLRPLAGGVAPIWLGAASDVAIKSDLRAAGAVRYAIVLVRGRMEGPGAYGAGGAYRYQIAAPTLEPIAMQETTIAELLDQPATAEGRFVRIVGGLLARETSALLVDRLGPGGLPEPKARQVKLRAPLRDQELLGRLAGPSGGAVRFGQVQIEGYWHGGTLAPLSITIVTS